MKRFFNFFTLIVMLSVLVVGCSEEKSDNGSQSGDNNKEEVTLSLLLESGSPAHKVAEATQEEYKKLTGVDIEIEAVPYSGIYDKLSAEIVAKNGNYDISCIDTIWFPSLYKGFVNLDETISADIPKDFAVSLIDGGSIDGNLYGIPAWANAKVMMYRTDLFEDESEKSSFKDEYGYDLAPPANWEEYRDMAEFFTRDTDGDGVTDLYGASMSAKIGGDTVVGWLDYALQAGASPLIIDGEEILVEDQPYIDAGCDFQSRFFAHLLFIPKRNSKEIKNGLSSSWQ